MSILLGVLFCYGVLYASRKAWENVKAEFSKSRAAHAKAAAGHARGRLSTRHDVAWWAREARYGFPVTRAGFHKGWLAHQLVMDQHFARREEARTSSMEARASVLSELKAHRQRQAAAQAVLDRVAAERGAPDELAVKRSTRRVDGRPETPADTRFFDHREAGYTGPLGRDGNPPDPSDPQDAKALETLTALRNQSANGGRMPDAEMNYTQTLDLATQIEVEADEEVRNVRYQRIANLLDALTSLGLDSGTQSDFGEVDEALKAQQKAAQATADAAAAARAGLVRRHGGIKEAVDSSPVNKPAEPEFYAE